MDNLTIVCFRPGTAGDLVTALIDSTNASVREQHVSLLYYRSRLKKPGLFKDNEEKDAMLKAYTCRSISSHDYAYHVDRGHKILCISVTDIVSAMWAAGRMKAFENRINRRINGSVNQLELLQDYIDFTKLIKENNNVVTIDLQNILNGSLISNLNKLGIKTVIDAPELYRRWLPKEVK